MRLGYILLPKKTADTDNALAAWTDDELAGADEVAFDVIRKIRQELFWPPSPEPAAFCPGSGRHLPGRRVRRRQPGDRSSGEGRR